MIKQQYLDNESREKMWNTFNKMTDTKDKFCS